MIYKSIILSKIDYASFVYGSARPTVLTKLDSIHHEGLRLSTGAFKSSPVLSLCIDAGIAPLSFRREELAANYMAKLVKQKDHPTHPAVFKQQYRIKYEKKANASKPIGIRLDFMVEKLITYNESELSETFPPWTFIPPQVNLDMKAIINKCKDVFIQEEVIQTFYKIISCYKEAKIIYTDGSKIGNSTSCAFYDGVESKMHKLNKHCNILTAELTAISQALYHLINFENQQIIICTDSLNSIFAICNLYPKNQIAQRIQLYINILQKSNNNITFLWIPSHMGIEGNDKADEAARLAHHLDIETPTPLTGKELANHIKQNIYEKWEKKWLEVGNNKLREIKNSTKAWDSSIRMNRREEVVVTRLRIGHSRFTHGYLMAKSEPPKCQKCNINLSIKHILAECPLYQEQRQEFHIPPEIYTALGNNPQMINNVILYLKSIDLFHEI